MKNKQILKTERGAAYMAAPLLFGTFFMLFKSHSSSISILISHLILELHQVNLRRKPQAC